MTNVNLHIQPTIKIVGQ